MPFCICYFNKWWYNIVWASGITALFLFLKQEYYYKNKQIYQTLCCCILYNKLQKEIFYYFKLCFSSQIDNNIFNCNCLMKTEMNKTKTQYHSILFLSFLFTNNTLWNTRNFKSTSLVINIAPPNILLLELLAFVEPNERRYTDRSYGRQ